MIRQSQKGFTIVELLIVIVVIGILAAIVIVAFNGIQTRANNTNKISTVQQYVKLIQAYSTANDAYPATTTSCATVDNDCTNSSGAVQTGSNNTALITELRKMGSVPQSMKAPADGAYGMQYIYGGTTTFNGEVYPIRLEYFLQGSATNCGIANITTAPTAGVTSTTGYSATTGNRTICWVMVR